jgi:tetratricopeptide (TPR) repeat protein
MRHPPPQLPQLYYLRNFRLALHWIRERYSDLLAPEENEFIEIFARLPEGSQALLVRLLMRKGPYFRGRRIAYPDIGDIATAAGFLIEWGWIDPHPLLSHETLLELISVAEAKALFLGLPKSATKAQLKQMVARSLAEPRTFEEWRCDVSESVLRLAVAPICTRLRLLFFGNFSQDWSEFVLADLGIFKYETVPLSNESRAFGCRRDIEAFFSLYECRCLLEQEGADLDEVIAMLPSAARASIGPDWLEARRAELIFSIAREFERSGKRESALDLYLDCRHPGARLRAIRTLEKLDRYEEAQALLETALSSPESDEESQRLPRVMRRLARRTLARRTLARRTQAGRTQTPLPVVQNAAALPRLDLILPAPASGQSVELMVSNRLSTEHAPVYYVENTLIKALFGLHFWEAIFAPVSGAFFHPFHVGPVDLYSRAFYEKRAALFEQGFARLESAGYETDIKNTFRAKHGIQSPFVSWRNLTLKLLDLALDCIPASHLTLYFRRLLVNLNENRNGLPDLVQFWPARAPREQSYQLIEVKGPGDRLQDNQKRWVQFCLEHQLPVVVCHVRWLEREMELA